MITTAPGLTIIQSELETGIELPKCQQCGCMAETLDQLAGLLPMVGAAEAGLLVQNVTRWQSSMRPIKYTCLGCEHCYPAVAQNALATAFPQVELLPALSCDFQIRPAIWPPVAGEYFVIDESAPVAVSTLASVDLAAALAELKPAGLAMVGKTETENIGLDKIIKNVITNPAIRFLILAGQEPAGHRTGSTLLALAENGVDAQGRVIGSPGKRPVLRNVSPAEIETFRQQIKVVDLIGCEDLAEIVAHLEELASRPVESCGCCSCSDSSPVSISTVSTLVADDPGGAVKMDPAGYFVIVPLADRGIINVEHYAYDHTLLRVIEGRSARALYRLIIDNGWVSELSHAAYLGRELTKAEFSLNHRSKYIQDGA